MGRSRQAVGIQLDAFAIVDRRGCIVNQVNWIFATRDPFGGGPGGGSVL